MEMITKYKLILEKDGCSVLEDSVCIEDVSIMGSRPNCAEFEKKIRDYIRGLNP